MCACVCVCVWQWVARGNIQQISYIPQTEQHSPFGLMVLCLGNITIMCVCVCVCVACEEPECIPPQMHQRQSQASLTDNSEHSTSLCVRQWGDPETTAEMITKFSLEWLGHLACMPNHQIGLVWMVYLALSKWRRWREVIRKDLKEIEDKQACSSRPRWSRRDWRVVPKCKLQHRCWNRQLEK